MAIFIFYNGKRFFLCLTGLLLAAGILVASSKKPAERSCRFYWFNDYTLKTTNKGYARSYFRAWKTSVDEFERRWNEYQKWFKEENKRRLQAYQTATGRARIKAARDLFEFAVKAKEKGEEILNNWALRGIWAGESYFEAAIPSVVYFSFEADLIFKIIPASSSKLKGKVIGKVKRGRTFLASARLLFSSSVPFITELSLIKKGEIKGNYSLPERTINVILNVKREVTAAIRDNSQYPFLIANFVRNFRDKAKYDFSAYLKGQLPQPYDLRDEYFLIYFNTFSSFFEEKIAKAKDFRQKAALAQEVFRKYLIDSLAIVQRHRLKQETIDRAKLWPRRADSSFNYWFNKYFTFTDGWYMEKIGSAIETDEKAGWAGRRFDFSIEAINEAGEALISDQLINNLGLKLAFPDSYPDKTFKLFFKLNDESFLEKARRLPAPQKLQVLLERFIPNSIKMFGFAQLGILSPQLIKDLGLIYPEAGSYADRTYEDYFREAYNFYSLRMKTLSPSSQAFNRTLSEFISWAKEQVSYASTGILSQAIVEKYKLYPGGLPNEIRRRFKNK